MELYVFGLRRRGFGLYKFGLYAILFGCHRLRLLKHYCEHRSIIQPVILSQAGGSDMRNFILFLAILCAAGSFMFFTAAKEAPDGPSWATGVCSSARFWCHDPLSAGLRGSRTGGAVGDHLIRVGDPRLSRHTDFAPDSAAPDSAAAITIR
jgi:hypothetical protein